VILQLKITLKHTSPPVWRRVQLDEQTTFRELHLLIQEAFNWEDAHLHEFMLNQTMHNVSFFDSGNIKIGSAEERDNVFESALDESSEILADYFEQEKNKALYIYDFGDDWQHEIVLENILYPEESVSYPVCLKAKGIAPEEDSIGVWEDEEVELPGKTNEKQVENDINLSFKSLLRQPEMSWEIKRERDIWRSLFAMIDRYKKTKLWDFLADDQIIIVELADTKERVYCSILGNAGQEFGIAVYIGDAGLASLQKLVSNPRQYGMDEVMHQRSLLLSLANRDELEEDDYSLIKRLGIAYRGKKQWPLFRSIKPGYYPWIIDEQEAIILTETLEIIVENANQWKQAPTNVPIVKEDKWLALLPVEKNESINWESKLLKPERVENEKAPAQLMISEIETKRIQKRFPLVEATLEFEGNYFPEPVQNHPAERPVYPVMVIAADQHEGAIIYNQLLQHENYEQHLQATFLEMVEQIEAIPAEIRVENTETLRILKPLFKMLSVHVVQMESLPVITHFYQEMRNNMDQFE